MIKMEKTIKFGVYVFIFILSLQLVLGASYWVADPTNCPASYQSQTCGTGTEVCGYNSGTTFCYNMTSITAPSSAATSNTDYTCEDTCDGGYVVDCYAYDGSSPHCDNSAAFWCDSNSTCVGWDRDTNCTPSVFGTADCGDCNTGYNDCDADGGDCEIHNTDACGISSQGTYYGCDGAIGDCTCKGDVGSTSNYYDCDGSGATAGDGCEIQYQGTCNDVGGNMWYTGCDGASGDCECKTNYYNCTNLTSCEVLDGSACTTGGGITGEWDGPTCTCTASKSYFETGTFVQYLVNIADGAMLWFQNLGTGDLINASNSAGDTYRVNNSGCVIYPDGSGQCTASVAGSGDITAVNTNGDYLTGGATTGDVSLLFNETALNATIDARGVGSSDTHVAGDGTYLTNDSTTMTFNTTLAGTSLSVNSSDYWDGYNIISELI